MRCARHGFGVTFTALALSALSGCGNGNSTRAVDASTAAAKVSGTIKINGEPMRGGEVVFIPLGAARKTEGGRIAKVKNDGSYEVTTLIGRNDVRIAGGPAVKKQPTLGYAIKNIDVDPAGGVVNLDFP